MTSIVCFFFASSFGKDHFFDCPVEIYGYDRDAYIQRCRRDAIQTFAVVKDSQWFERGDMGWWGIVHDEKDSDQWSREFEKLIEGLSDDTMLTVVDCHI